MLSGDRTYIEKFLKEPMEEVMQLDYGINHGIQVNILDEVK